MGGVGVYNGGDFMKRAICISMVLVLSGGLLLGCPPEAPFISRLVINDNAVKTSSCTVFLSNICTGEPTEYLVSESASFEGALWQPYTPSAAFTLSPGNGPKTVYFKVRNAGGESEVLSGSITLEEPMPPTVTSLSINGGAATTTSRTVALNTLCAGGPLAYQASESPSFEGASWEAYTPAPLFDVSAGNGLKTVYFKVRNEIGESGVSSATITLNLPEPPALVSLDMNGGAILAASRTVTLNNICTGAATEYVASESPSFGGAAWLPYAVAPSFTLSGGTGTKTVYLKVRNTGGESEVVSDTITLEETMPPTMARLAINGGAPSTVSRAVTLNNACSENPTACMASESASFAGAEWQAYATAPLFTLSTGNQTKTVYFKTRNAAGESAVISDTITLSEPVPPTLVTLAINGGAVTAASRTVILSNASTGAPTEYMAADNAAFTGGVWQPYSAAPSFTLSQGNGTRTVYLKLRNAVGESGVLSDTITLNEIILPVVTAFTINNDATATTSRSVTLNSACTGEPTQLMASESATFTGAGWQAYTTATAFTLSTGNGTKTVYFKVRSAMGESAVVASDTITLNEPVPPTVGSLTINRGAASTLSRTVTLDNTCAENPTEYMASESSSFAGASWQAYSTSPTFTLSSFDGVKTVYFKVRNAVNASSVVNDTIVLNEVKPPVISVFVINAGAAATASAMATLNNLYTNTVTEYMASELADFSDASWQPYSMAPDFTLSSGNETKTVYLKLRNAGGESASVSDTITLNESASTGYVFDCAWPNPLSDPDQLAIDPWGNKYIVSSNDHCVRRFAPDGTFVMKWGSNGAGNGQFTYPYDVAVDQWGSVYVADSNNDRIQKFLSDGTYVTQWGGSGTGDGQFDVPCGIATDRSGNVYVLDRYNNRVQKFTSDGTFLAKWGVQGSGDGQFFYAYDLAVDESGNVYVADSGNDRIQRFTSAGVFVAKWGSSGTGDGQFDYLKYVTVDKQGYVYAVDYNRRCVQKFTSSGVFVTKWGSGGMAEDQFEWSCGVAVDITGEVQVVDQFSWRVLRFTPDGGFVSWWGAPVITYGGFHYPSCIAVTATDRVYVADTQFQRVVEFTSDGTYIRRWGSAMAMNPGNGNGELNYPYGVAVDAAGNVYVADTYNHRVQKFTADGTYLAKWGTAGWTGDGQFYYPTGIAVDGSAAVYVVDSSNNRIQKFTSSGVFLSKWGSIGTGDGQFSYPTHIAVDSLGNLYVTDYGNNRVQKFTSTGVFVTKWGSLGTGNGQFDRPFGIAVDNSGNVYVADSYNRRIQKFTPDGTYVTQWGSTGSALGKFDLPRGVAVDTSGNVYVADTQNGRIQKFRPE